MKVCLRNSNGSLQEQIDDMSGLAVYGYEDLQVWCELKLNAWDEQGITSFPVSKMLACKVQGAQFF